MKNNLKTAILLFIGIIVGCISMYYYCEVYKYKEAFETGEDLILRNRITIPANTIIYKVYNSSEGYQVYSIRFCMWNILADKKLRKLKSNDVLTSDYWLEQKPPYRKMDLNP